MAKVTITIEDIPGRDGMVKTVSDPNVQELMRRISSGDVPSHADTVAASALMYLRNKGKVLIRPRPSIIKPD